MAKQKAPIDRARKLVAAGKFPQALRIIDKILAKQPNHFELQKQAGFILCKLNKIQKALPYLERAAALKVDLDVIRQVAHIYDQEKRLQQKQEFLEKALEGAGFMPEIAFPLLDTYLTNQYFSRAAELFEEAEQHAPLTTMQLAWFANAAAHSLDHFHRAQDLITATRQRPDLNADNMWTLAQACKWLGDYQQCSEIHLQRFGATKDPLQLIYSIHAAIYMLRLSGNIEATKEAAVTCLQHCEALKPLVDQHRPGLVDAVIARLKYLSGGTDWLSYYSATIGQKGFKRLAEAADPSCQPFLASVQRLRTQIKGKTIVLMLNGPSLKQLDQLNMDLSSRSDIVLVAINKFKQVTDYARTNLHRRLDILFGTEKKFLLGDEATITETLAENPQAFLISREVATSSVSYLQKSKKLQDQFVTFIDTMSLPPTPQIPCQFERTNSLTQLLAILTIAEPAQIILFGADGGASAADQPSTDVYFFQKDTMSYESTTNYNAAHAKNTDGLARLRREAMQTDEICAFQLDMIADLYGLASVPRIYNCCMHSAYQLFEKIDIDAARSLLAPAK